MVVQADVFAVREMIVAFLRTVLKPDWKYAIDMDSLAELSNEFVPDRGAKRRGDFVWQASFDKNLTPEERLKYGLDPDCNTICFYVMIEFQSTVDKLMPLRIDAYKSQLRLRLAELSGLPVPQIVPFVLYSGDRKWNVSTKTEPLLAKPLPGLEEESYYLVDLNDPRWASDPVNNAFKLAAKFNQCKSVPELHAKLSEHADWLSDRPVEPSLVDWLYDVRMVILRGGPVDDDELLSLSRNLDTRERKMALIQQLTKDVERIREEGFLAGETHGREEDFRAGEVRGEASTLVKVILKKYGSLPESLRTMIHETTDVARLDEMLDLTLSCKTLEEFQERLK